MKRSELRQIIREEIKRLKESKNSINEATSSQIGYIDKNGNIVSTYVHLDGYPDGVGKIAKQHYGGGKVKKLLAIDKGVGISSLHPKMDGGEGHSWEHPKKDQTVFYGRDRGEKGGKFMTGKLNKISSYIEDAYYQEDAEYVYLYNEKDRKWYYADLSKNQGLKLL